MNDFAQRRFGVFAALLIALVGIGLTAIASGSVTVPIADTLRILFRTNPSDPRWQFVVETIRLPRAITAASVGAALGVAGLQMQTLFRNVLADPFVLGVSSGASLGVSLVTVLTGGSVASFAADVAGLGRVGVVIAAAIGAGVVLTTVLIISRWVQSPVTLLVIGVMIGYAVTAVVSVMLMYADPQRAQLFLAWGLGSFASTTWPDLIILLPTLALGLGLALGSVKHLNALLLGDDYARTMGLNIRRARAMTLVGACLLSGATTAFCGPVAFLGLAVPYLARLAIGTSDHRVLMPATLLMGAVVALACAIATQLPGSDTVLPLNVVTSLLGAPIVVTALVRSRHGAGLTL